MYKVFISGKPIYFPSRGASASSIQNLTTGPSKLLRDPAKLAAWVLSNCPDEGVLFPNKGGTNSWDEFQVHVRNMPAAGGAIRDDKGRILFIFRRGHWDLPKGKIDPGESIKKAARREVEEECGIEGVRIEGPLPVSYHMFERKDRWYIKPTFWFLMSYDGPQDFTPQAEEDIEEVEWMTEGQFNIARPTFRNIKDIAKAAFNWQPEAD